MYIDGASRSSSERFTFVQHPPGPMRRRWPDYGVGLVAPLAARTASGLFLHINATGNAPWLVVRALSDASCHGDKRLLAPTCCSGKMPLRAPATGILYHGKKFHGRWSDRFRKYPRIGRIPYI